MTDRSLRRDPFPSRTPRRHAHGALAVLLLLGAFLGAFLGGLGAFAPGAAARSPSAAAITPTLAVARSGAEADASPWRVALSDDAGRSVRDTALRGRFAPRPTPRPAPPFRTEAEAAILLNASTGAVLYARQADQPIPPASMTKMMTAYMVFEAVRDGVLKDRQRLRVAEQVVGTPGSSMFLRGGQKPRVIDLLRGLIIQSGNDAARQFAITLAGSEAAFAEAMTRRARALGLTTARFRNATGLPARGHEVSVADLARLAQFIRRDFPERMPLFSEKSFEWSGVRQRNRNPALFLRLGKNVRPVGMKTGHTSVAGYCVVASARKTRRNGETVEVIAVLAGLDSEQARERETEAALLWALEKID